MPTDVLENIDERSPVSRRELRAQAKRVKKEARRLRSQVRDLRGADHAAMKERQHVREHLIEMGKGQGREALKRGGEVTSTSAGLAGDLTRLGLSYGSNLLQDWSQRGGQAAANLRDTTIHNVRHQGQYLKQNTSDWRKDAPYQLRKQGRQATRQAADWRDEAAYSLRKQGRHATQYAADWRDDAVYSLRKQGRHMQQSLMDFVDELSHTLLKQGQYFLLNLIERREQARRSLRKQSRDIGRNLAERREDAAWEMSKRRRDIGRNLAERREDTARQLSKRGRNIGRNLLEQREGASHQLRKRVSRPLYERNGSFWSMLGFLAGLLVAGGVTYWLLKRIFQHAEEGEEGKIELQRETLNESGWVPSGEIRYTTNQGGTAVATRRNTLAGPTSKFVGVLSTRQYYPVERRPPLDERELVFFVSEEDARAEGFQAAR